MVLFSLICLFAFKAEHTPYTEYYQSSLSRFSTEQEKLLLNIKDADLAAPAGIGAVKTGIKQARLKLKAIDFWLRYLEPVAYKQINGPLPVEWENEVFEKFEKPYKRLGAGLSLAELYLNNKGSDLQKDSLLQLIRISQNALNTYTADSVTSQLKTPDHFFLCNRLYLLNLAAIYTTGFECPDNGNIIPELKVMMQDVRKIYASFGQSFPGAKLSDDYLELYARAMSFVNVQPDDFEQFDHFTFLKDYVNPLFAINQRLIRQYNVISVSFNDYTLNNSCNSIFDKSLYTPQNAMGIYSLIEDTAVLSEIRAVGKLLFYDPLLSGNNSRTCVSCHKSKEYFTDTTMATSFNFDHIHFLPRNTPSLVNVIYNHLLMLDGRHISLQNQAKDVMTNPAEMGGKKEDIMDKILSCKEYKTAFRKFLKYTPEEKEITFDHIASAITYYYKDFSGYYSPFDDAMNQNRPLSPDARKGFNLFMSKAQCATCHYVPQFNGVPPPYIGSEFEVIGVPADISYSKLSEDSGRYKINTAYETMNAFRTGNLRNLEYTKPYMHNGVFTTLDQVIDFYDAGGGTGKKLSVPNQSLSTDSLKLTATEKKELLSFLHSLNEAVIFENPPGSLPVSSRKELNGRRVGGDY